MICNLEQLVYQDEYGNWQQPKLFLLNPETKLIDSVEYPTTISVLGGVESVVLKATADEVSELVFDIYRCEEDVGDVVWNAIRKPRYIGVSKADDSTPQYLFRIKSVERTTDLNGEYKTITAESCEVELSEFEVGEIGTAVTTPSGKTTYNYSISLYSLILKINTWTMGSWAVYYADIEADKLALVRTFDGDYASTSLYDFLLNDFATSYEVDVDFNTAGRIIILRNANTYSDTDVYLSQDTVVGDIQESVSDDEYATAYKLCPDDDLEYYVRAVNPTGLYVYNTDLLTIDGGDVAGQTNGLISDSLRNKVLQWVDDIESREVHTDIDLQDNVAVMLADTLMSTAKLSAQSSYELAEQQIDALSDSEQQESETLAHKTMTERTALLDGFKVREWASTTSERTAINFSATYLDTHTVTGANPRLTIRLADVTDGYTPYLAFYTGTKGEIFGFADSRSKGTKGLLDNWSWTFDLPLSLYGNSWATMNSDVFYFYVGAKDSDGNIVTTSSSILAGICSVTIATDLIQKQQALTALQQQKAYYGSLIEEEGNLCNVSRSSITYDASANTFSFSTGRMRMPLSQYKGSANTKIMHSLNIGQMDGWQSETIGIVLKFYPSYDSIEPIVTEVYSASDIESLITSKQASGLVRDLGDGVQIGMLWAEYFENYPTSTDFYLSIDYTGEGGYFMPSVGVFSIDGDMPSEAELNIFNSDLSIPNYDGFSDLEKSSLVRTFVTLEYSNDNIVITDSMTETEKLEQALAFVQSAKSDLANASSVKYSFSVETANFVFDSNYKLTLHDVSLNKTIRVEIEKGSYVKLPLKGFEVDFKDLTATLTFGSITKYANGLVKILRDTTTSVSRAKVTGKLLANQCTSLDEQITELAEAFELSQTPIETGVTLTKYGRTLAITDLFDVHTANLGTGVTMSGYARVQDGMLYAQVRLTGVLGHATAYRGRSVLTIKNGFDYSGSPYTFGHGFIISGSDRIPIELYRASGGIAECHPLAYADGSTLYFGIQYPIDAKNITII